MELAERRRLNRMINNVVRLDEMRLSGRFKQFCNEDAARRVARIDVDARDRTRRLRARGEGRDRGAGRRDGQGQGPGRERYHE